VGEGSQGVWTTCLIQCPNILYKIFFKILHPSAFEKILQKKKSFELSLLLKDLLIRLKGPKGKLAGNPKPLR
jgi:hypothetical protein